MLRKLFVAPSPVVGLIYQDDNGVKTEITNEGFAPSSVDTSTLEPAPFDITAQATVDNALLKLNNIKAEIQAGIEAFL